MAQLDDFNVIQFEKRLTALKDSQDNINACCKWCLENRQHHKKIVNSWLNVLKRVKVEQRLNLFYLANDVIQYSKRKQYEFVESWGTALQKATTLVRDDKVKHKIVRIFNIWQQRGVYNEEFISDLCGLISVVPTAPKNDEPHEFQANYVINKIKQCTKLENETDSKLKILKEHNPKIPIETESLCVSLKDRAHVDDVEKELETYVKHLEGYINALKAEIKCRITNISVLKQANNQLDKDKKDVKVVANAYKLFGNKVKTFQKKLEEHRATLASPIPSPDINAPSPSPDCDIELPDDEPKRNDDFNPLNPNTSFSVGYYNPVPPPNTEATNFVTNGYTSFIGSNFGVEGIFTTTQTTSATSNLTEVTNSNFNLNMDLRTVLQSVNPPPPPSADAISESSRFPYQEETHLPLLPPPMPPFSTKSDYENPYDAYSNTVSSHSTTTMAPSMNYGDTSLVAPSAPAYDTSTNYNAPSGFEAIPPPTSSTNQMRYQLGGDDAAEYNPEQETETWETDAGGDWPPPQPHSDAATLDTPESPPMFEKEGYIEGVEYHDGVNSGRGAVDVDHRLLHPMMDGIRGRGKDVDHRNLISLTGSPADTNSNLSWGAQMADKDKHKESLGVTDQDYRLAPFNFEHLKLPPPPPPPPKPQPAFSKNKSPPKKLADNTESIDMELSEDDDVDVDNCINNSTNHKNNLKVLVHENDVMRTLKPPPPFPDLPDDVDANSFLDDLDNELNSNEFTANLQDPDCGVPTSLPPPPMVTNLPPPNFMPNHWQTGPPPPPLPPINMNNHPPHHHQQMKGPPPFINNFEFNRRGAATRGGRPPTHRGRGRGQFGFRGANNFRGRGFSRGHKGRGGMRGTFQGGY